MSAKIRLQDQFKAAYDPAAWMQIIQACFPLFSCDFFEHPETLDVSTDFIQSTQQIGNLNLGDETIALLQIEVSDSVQLARNRVALRNFVSSFIDEVSSTAVLVVFHQPGRPDWRVTYAARSTGFDEETLQITSAETAPRRYTFLVGRNEPCRTVAGRFAELEAKGDELTLPDVEKAFSVERLNKEFFKKYKEHYVSFCDYLLGSEQRDHTYQVFGIDGEATADADEKPVRDFVKRLLGRVVFIHFLQKKGWMGCPAGRDAWEDGEADFLYKYFQASKDPATFHSARLVPLFYGALNTPNRAGDVFEPTGTRIPYLNGGLFEGKLEQEAQVDFPTTHFEALLDFFAQYNFIIDENDPEEQEVGIDPEMLGHIFENLLEDNKDKGAYYTPKAIVQYMAQQSLSYYLLSHLGETDESRAAVEYLLRAKQLGENTPHEKWNETHARKISDLLDAVKICDPAIGSGAFPIGLLKEIFWLKLTLNPTLNEPSTLADLKRDIIQNSIYGVDLDAGAVDIARLRFWLALIVDEEAPRALPNLNYKIMQGDSLLESFEGIDLSTLHTGADDAPSRVVLDTQGHLDLGGTREQQELIVQQRRADITARIESYYLQTDPDAKKRIHAEIDQQVRTHIERSLALMDEELDGYIDQREKMLSGELARIRGFSEAKAQRQIVAYQKQRDGLAEKQARLEALEGSDERPFFLWHLFFQDVFAQGGFDIVIANPPYVRQEVIKDLKPKLKEAGYCCYTGTADLFVYFYERSVGLLRDGGTLTHITSNKYYRAGYGAKLRTMLAEDLRLRELLDFGDAPVFDAIAYASILIGEKGGLDRTSSASAAAYTWKRSDRLPQIADIMQEQSFPLAQSNLTSDGWRLERPDVFFLLKKLKGKGTPLGEYVDGRFYYGIKTGFNEAFVVDRETRDRLIAEDPKSEEVLKPFLRGRDVKRWKANFDERYLIKIESSENKKHPWSGLPSKEAEEVFKNTYPAIYNRFNDIEIRKALVKRSDQGKYFWELRSCAYWEGFEQTKIIYPELSEEARFLTTSEIFYTDCTTYVIPHSDDSFVSILNSSVSRYFVGLHAATNMGGAIRWKNQYLSPLPIPSASVSEKFRLSELAEAAESAQGDDLEVIETEINQIVYRLFDLTDEEIKLIERSLGRSREVPEIKGKHGLGTEKERLFRRLTALLEAQSYISFDLIQSTVKQERIDLDHDTLRQYLQGAVEKGLIHSAGKAWYSRFAEPLPLDDSSLQAITQSLQAKFPLLPVCCWNTQQLNPYLEHLLGVSVTFITVEADAVTSVAEYLKAEGHTVVENPRGEVQRKLLLEDGLVVIRPGVLWQNYTEGPVAPWEVLLVQAWQEASRLGFIDQVEFQEMVARALSRGRVQLAPLLAYMGKSKIQPKSVFSENDSLSENTLKTLR